MRLAIVLPCYNEEPVLPMTLEAVSELLSGLIRDGLVSSDSYACFVDDGSGDRTWQIIADAAARNPLVKGIKLSRNRGHQNALLAGLLEVDADAVISVDADLQDDLSAVRQMLEHARQGADIVYGVRRSRASDSWFKRFTAHAYYSLLKHMGADTVYDHADFRLMSRRAIAAMAQYRETNLFLRGIVPLLGLPNAIVEYDRSPRAAGQTKYPFRRMLALAVVGITSFSAVPLHVITWLGLAIAMLSLATGVWALSATLLGSNVVPGWASTVIPIYFLGGIQLLALGVIGEYLAKTYLEVKQRPRYLIEKRIG